MSSSLDPVGQNNIRPPCNIITHDNIRGFLNWHQVLSDFVTSTLFSFRPLQ
jgi:hypothetical protein